MFSASRPRQFCSTHDIMSTEYEKLLLYCRSLAFVALCGIGIFTLPSTTP